MKLLNWFINNIVEFAILVAVLLGLTYLGFTIFYDPKVDFCYIEGEELLKPAYLVQHRHIVSNIKIRINSNQEGVELAKELNCPITR